MKIAEFKRKYSKQINAYKDALEKVGDVSGKVKGDSYGYYIIRYVSDSVEGPIALEEVKETLQSSLLSTKQNTTYNDTLQGWVDAADFKVNLDALKDCRK